MQVAYSGVLNRAAEKLRAAEERKEAAVHAAAMKALHTLGKAKGAAEVRAAAAAMKML